MGMKLSKIKRPKQRRKKKAANAAIEFSDHTPFNSDPFNLESQEQAHADDHHDHHNCFSITNWEDNDIDNLTDDEKNDDYSNIYEDADGESLDGSLDGTKTVDASAIPLKDGMLLTEENKLHGHEEDLYGEEDLYDQVPADKLQTEFTSKTTKITNQKSSFDSAYCGDFQSITSKTSSSKSYFGQLSANKSKHHKSKSLLKKNDDCYTGLPVWSGKKTFKDQKSRKLNTDVMPENFVPQMVEAFRPLIEECIRVNEVLPYLHFLAEKEVIEAKERESPKRAASLLLDQIIASDELGKWTTFIAALKTVGYNYVANTLLGETELDLTVQRNLLRVFIPELINNLQPSELIDHLFSRDVISGTDKEEIECELRNRGSSAASLMLLDRIPRRIHDWYSEFVGALRTCGFEFLADKIDIPEVTSSSTSSSSDGSSSACLTISQETQKKSVDNLYITPNDYIPELHSPTPPPVPKRPETTRTVADKRVLPYAVTSFLNLTNENMKHASHVDLINEKRRLAVELEDAKQRKILKKDIKVLRKQIELLENDESDDGDDHVCDPLLNKTTPIRKQKFEVEEKDMLNQAKEKDNPRNSSTQTNLIKETTHVINDLQTDAIKLKDITLNDFLEILNAKISNDVTQTIKKTLTQRYGDHSILSNLSPRSSNPINELVHIRPRAHTRLHESASDSGMYSSSEYMQSLSAWYADAPPNYV